MSADLAEAMRGATRAMEGLVAAMREKLPPFPSQNAVAYLAFARAERKYGERLASRRKAISEAMRRSRGDRQ
jgi:hypothetical protein